MKKKLYLDIDGVILTKRNTQAAVGVMDFVDYVLENYDCYWLTTHCRNNDTFPVLAMLSQYFPAEYVEKMK